MDDIFPLIIAHRGASDEAPENTLAAFERADRLDADIEFDVQLSADGVPVVIHDETLDRTTSGRGRVSEHTLRELRALDAGGWFSPRFRGERIPTLLETLTSLRAFWIAELKSPGTPAARERLVRAVASDLRRVSRKICPMFTSFDRGLVGALRRRRGWRHRDADVSYALNLDRPPRHFPGRPWKVRGTYHAICPFKGLVTPRRVVEWTAFAGRDCRMVFAWTADAPSEWRHLIAAGVDGIMTNRPRALRMWLNSRA